MVSANCFMHFLKRTLCIRGGCFAVAMVVSFAPAVLAFTSAEAENLLLLLVEEECLEPWRLFVFSLS